MVTRFLTSPAANGKKATLGKELEAEGRLGEVAKLAACKELFADLRVKQPWIKDGHKVKLPSSRCPWSTRSAEIILSVYGTLNIDKLFASEWAIGTAELAGDQVTAPREVPVGARPGGDAHREVQDAAELARRGDFQECTSSPRPGGATSRS